MKKMDPWAIAREAEQDISLLDLEGLKHYRQDLEERIQWMDQREPSEEDIEEYEAWADAHELLEDLLDEALDALEGM